MSIFIKHIQGSKIDQLESFETDAIRVGRQSDNDLRFDPQQDASVSGYHAEIYRDGDRYFIKDLQSRNGTFVNSRRIDRPVALKDGDAIQFSSRGPKVVFSTTDPATANEPVVSVIPESAPTEGFVREEKVSTGIRVGNWEKLRPMFPVALGVGGLALLVAVGSLLDFSWWVLLMTCAFTLLLGGGSYLGWRWWNGQKEAVAQKESAQQERELSLGRGNNDNLKDMSRKWTEVLRSLRSSKLQRSGDDPVYAFPWFLMIGEIGSGKSALIKVAGSLSSVATTGGDGPTRNCDWWFFDKSLILDVSGRYVLQAKGSDVAGEWQTLLSELKSNRRREPLNGVIVTLPADAVISRPFEKLKEEAAQLRERVDEMVQVLGVKFPVYLVVSKSDLIPGFDDLFGALPDQTKGQALGHVNSDAMNNSDAGRFFERAFRTIYARAERLRLAALLEQEQLEPSLGIFLLPAELKSLQAPLRSFVEVLFRPSPYHDAPFFRGLFFLSARQTSNSVSRLARLFGLSYSRNAPQKPSRDIFLRDFFAVVLPNDRVLVSQTATTRERYQLTRAAGLNIGLAASLLLTSLFALSFTNNWLALSRLVVDPCTTIEAGSNRISHTLRSLDECRANIEGVMPRTFGARMAYGFGLDYSKQVGEKLQDRYVSEFGAKIVDPINDRIDKALSGDTADALVVSFVIQRLQRLATCQQNRTCVDGDHRNAISYQTMLAVSQGQLKEGDPDVERLQRTHEAFLLWQSNPKVLSEMYSKDLQRVRTWSRRGRLTEDWVLESTKSQFAPVRAADFWGGAGTLRVDGAYTARAWREGIAPLVSGLQKMATDQDFGAALRNFYENYQERALGQWDNFIAKFPDGESNVYGKSNTREFGASILGPESPYYRVIETANANLSLILGETWQENKLQPWASTLKRFVELKQKIQKSAGSGKAATPENVSQQESAAKYLAMYQDAVAEYRAEFSTPDKCFKSAQKAFQEPEPNKRRHWSGRATCRSPPYRWSRP